MTTQIRNAQYTHTYIVCICITIERFEHFTEPNKLNNPSLSRVFVGKFFVVCKLCRSTQVIILPVATKHQTFHTAKTRFTQKKFQFDFKIWQLKNYIRTEKR